MYIERCTRATVPENEAIRSPPGAAMEEADASASRAHSGGHPVTGALPAKNYFLSAAGGKP